jgi:hypothetical protein
VYMLYSDGLIASGAMLLEGEKALLEGIGHA